MTNQEAIDVIKQAIAEVEWEYPMEYAVAFDMAVEALEKQMPMKPVIKPDDELEMACCPVCGRLCNAIASYCAACGQVLDWTSYYKEKE